MQKRILIVDDDPSICHSLALVFRDEGYFVDERTDSGDAAILIKEEKYDVYLFDYKMSGLTGIDLLRLVKDVNKKSSVFIISGMMNIEQLCQKESKAGLVAGIISKPFDVEALVQRIAAVV